MNYISDILFFIKSPNNSFDIMNYVSFSSATRFSGTKLCYRVTDNCISSHQIYTFTEFPNFGILSLKLI